MKQIVISGATGLIGRPLTASLVARGDRVTAWVRDVERARRLLGDAVTPVAADLETPGPWQEVMAGADAVLHLAGESLAEGRWNARRKERIRESRVESTRVIVEGIAALPAERRPRALIVASGTDYYPFADSELDDDDLIDERTGPGSTYLARVCRDWEGEAAAAASLGVRVVSLRTGVVIAPGGALAKMTGPFRWFVGGPLGSGLQWFSWIHLDDAVAVYRAAVDDERYRGPINLVGPETVRASGLARALGKALGRPSWLPVPGFAVRAVAGELSEYLLHGRRVTPAALQALDYKILHPTLDDALAAALR